MKEKRRAWPCKAGGPDESPTQDPYPSGDGELDTGGHVDTRARILQGGGERQRVPALHFFSFIFESRAKMCESMV
jgi:hypothetical protein